MRGPPNRRADFIIEAMQHFRSFNDIRLQNAWLAIGVYDGVHRGHQSILRPMVESAHRASNPAVALTFWPHPAQVLGHAHEMKFLTTVEERAEALGALGVDYVITMNFNNQLAATSAYDFMALLKTCLGVKQLWLGYDSTLGKNREGNVARLTEIGRELDYAVRVTDALMDESGVISSTTIRKLVSTGQVRAAASLLGRAYSVRGEVVAGDGRGRTIGIPTANIALPAEKAVPANGVYACQAMLDGATFQAVTNIGVRPTFGGGDPTVHVEAHLLNFTGDLYGKTLSLGFVERLRNEMKFSGVEALIAQINADVARARAILGGQR